MTAPRVLAHEPAPADGAPVPRSNAALKPVTRAPRARPKTWRILAVGGGKGGIGKSMLTANLGVELAQRGYKVVGIDADLGGANLHTCLGVPMPKVSLSDFVNRRVSRIEEVAIPTGVPNLSIISGALDALDIANPKYAQKIKLLRSIQSLDVDYAILDLGAGTSYNVLDFFLVADHGILVLVPEPTSIENGYRFIKAAFFRRLQNIQSVYGIEKIVEEAVSQRGGTIKTPHDVIAAVKKRDADAGESLEREMRLFRPRLVVNQTRTAADREVGDAVVAAWRKYFGLEMDFLGAVGYDDEVWKAVRKRRPVMLERPEAETSRCIRAVASRLIALDEATAR